MPYNGFCVPCVVIPTKGTSEKARSEAEGTLSFRAKRRQEGVPDGSPGDADTFSTVPKVGIQACLTRKEMNLDTGFRRYDYRSVTSNIQVQ